MVRGDKLLNCQIAFPDKKSGGDRLPLLHVMIQTGKLGLKKYFSISLIIPSAMGNVYVPSMCLPASLARALPLSGRITGWGSRLMKKSGSLNGGLAGIPVLGCSLYGRSYLLPISRLRKRVWRGRAPGSRSQCQWGCTGYTRETRTGNYSFWISQHPEDPQSRRSRQRIFVHEIQGKIVAIGERVSHESEYRTGDMCQLRFLLGDLPGFL